MFQNDIVLCLRLYYSESNISNQTPRPLAEECTKKMWFTCNILLLTRKNSEILSTAKQWVRTRGCSIE